MSEEEVEEKKNAKVNKSKLSRPSKQTSAN